ncbi:hypothetical protein DFS34DRAFT_602571 [Phlyctochytrium arcticum]|nr:hypothetical protein DFS34DRAFT_602571 [Phlyctochytrium arcticum]
MTDSAQSPTDKLSATLVKYGLPSVGQFIDRPGSTPYPAALVSTLCFASAIPSLRRARGWPGYFPLIGFGAVFAGASYVLARDPDNGASTTTAWGLVYASLFTRSTLASRRIGPIGLLLTVVGTTGLYGAEMWETYFA